MQMLPEDALFNIYLYLTPEELTNWMNSRKKISHQQQLLYKIIWQQHLLRKWGLPRCLIKSYLERDSLYLRRLFNIGTKVIHGITSDDADVQCDALANAAYFKGTVGEGNRSVQSASCFPVQRTTTAHQFSFVEKVMDIVNILAETFCLRKHTKKHPKIFAHSSPFAYKVGANNIAFFVSPRLISYYEVEIKALPTTPGSNNSSQLYLGGNNNRAECVAVGLATKSFMKNKLLPGWDQESYGYHGDDGAIFHGRGSRQIADFGPSFGYNDIIGCGLNHRDRSIFFTINGALLGTAFRNVPIEKALYPTVGIDAHCSVHFNFGATTPFVYNLLRHIEEYPAAEMQPVRRR